MTKVKEKKIRKSSRPTVKEYLKERLKDIPLTVMMGAFVAFCIASIIYFICIGRYRDIPIGFAYMAIVAVFYIAEYTLNVRSPYGYTVFMLLFVLFCFLGASYNFYGLIPPLDDILHAAWGIVFSVVGIILIKGLMGAPKTAKGVIAYVLFGLGFAMLLSVAWEIYEFSGDSLIHSMDMQQDTIVHHFHSFFLHEPYDNLHTVEIDGITKTVITYMENGVEKTLTLDGYLDLGLYDTMYDLIFCFCTTAVFSVILAIDWCKGKYFYRFIIPSLVGEKYDRRGNMLELSGGESGVTAADGVPVAETEAVTEEPEEEPAEGKEVAEEAESEPAEEGKSEE
ncbi:MAG: hypothetical protein NC033_05980 [Clostridiales bacterium]|nr:hypothetical protein [Clostridiales bacterium]